MNVNFMVICVAIMVSASIRLDTSSAAVRADGLDHFVRQVRLAIFLTFHSNRSATYLQIFLTFWKGKSYDVFVILAHLRHNCMYQFLKLNQKSLRKHNVPWITFCNMIIELLTAGVKIVSDTEINFWTWM